MKKHNFIAKKRPKNDYHVLFQNVSGLLKQARKHVYSKVNLILVNTYWNIGKEIVKSEQSGKKEPCMGKKQ